MIDRLPLDLFGDVELEPAAPADEEAGVVSAPQSAATVTCPWCATRVPADARTCPACEAMIPVAEPPTPARHDGICQWCGATIEPALEVCPACGWDARGGIEIEMPGLTTPLSEEQIRSLYGGEDPEPGLDDSIAIAAEIISLIVPRG